MIIIERERFRLSFEKGCRIFMENYRIITDSTCDLTRKMVQEADVDVIPMDFTLGPDSFRDYPDEHEISSAEFYRRLAAGEPSMTNQITEARFEEAFEPYLKQGIDVLYLGFSSGLSATFNNSVLAAKVLQEKYPERRLAVVDTLAASVGEGLIAWLAGKMKCGGASLDEVKLWVEQNRLKAHHWFTVDNLMYLRRGGRISGAAAMMGTMLGVKPVMHVDDAGRLVLVEKVRGRRQSLDSLLDHMARTVVNPAEQTVFIGHSEYPEGAEYVRAQIEERFGVKEFRIACIGPVIGAHMGAGSLDFFYLGTDRDFGLNKETK